LRPHCLAQYDRLHAEGFLTTEVSDAEKCPPTFDVEAVRSRCRSFDASRFYSDIRYFADYGTDYRRVTGLFVNDDEALVEVDGLTEEMKKK
jgi:hypothetical protein